MTAHAASASPAPAVAPLRFEGGPDGKLILLDQTKLPAETVELQIARVDELAAAIHRLSVRGAPAIGVAGGYGVVLALREYIQKPDVHKTEILKSFDASVNIIKSARPTAVNLAWGVDRVAAVARAALAAGSVAHALDLALAEARAIEAEDRNCCERIGRIGADLLNLQNGASVLTHCNAGALATTGIGTALGVIYTAAGDGRRIIVYADETRPLLQGSRLTAYELTRAGIEVRVVTDGMAARVMSTNKISAVIVGADRIALNGDTANKIGTQALAIIAKHFGVPFYVAAPLSTFDPTIPDGSKIPIEMRSGEEVTEIGGIRTAPSGTGQFNPAFDVTPAALISAIITEEGAASPPNRETISALLARGNIKIH
ncbi:MAG: S-methyl-5-thioribose-1-phosphate isomerase [Planctomycetes bacterium]|nr:S-methyl-5-thioribose-1-phosphate isomerase [Planctomycetota bacterium]